LVKKKTECGIGWLQILPSSWLAAWPMFWAQFTAILRARASNASCMATGLSQSSAVESHQTRIITIINKYPQEAWNKYQIQLRTR
jgi:hypothetical protein